MSPMKSFILKLMAAFGLVGMVSCEKPIAPEIPAIMDSGASFGPFKLGGDSAISAVIRLKFIANAKPGKVGTLKYIVEIKPAAKDFDDLGGLARVLNEEEKSTYVSQYRKYLNTFTFTLEDKDGFSITKIKIEDPTKQPLVFREKSVLEYSGETYLSKEEALKIDDCTLTGSFQPNLKRILKIPD